MKGLRHILLTVTTYLIIHSSFGQSKIDTITLKKGEVFDILLLSQHPDRDAELKSYFQSAFPIAKKMSYQPLPGFKIINNNQGNLHPNILVLGKWDNTTIREAFLTEILKDVPDFHERRRKIWSYFGLRYFKIESDLSFQINRNHYNVATAYWLESDKRPNPYYKKWEQEIETAGGKILIQLKNGTSPFGYQYNPEYFVITSWKREADFRSFQEKMKKQDLNGVQHINEFILQ